MSDLYKFKDKLTDKRISYVLCLNKNASIKIGLKSLKLAKLNEIKKSSVSVLTTKTIKSMKGKTSVCFFVVVIVVLPLSFNMKVIDSHRDSLFYFACVVQSSLCSLSSLVACQGGDTCRGQPFCHCFVCRFGVGHGVMGGIGVWQQVTWPDSKPAIVLPC